MAYIGDETTARTTVSNNTPTPLRSRILVVDDNHQIVVTVTLMLKALGFDVDTANCGIAALNCLERNNYDAVLTDLEMPDMTGDLLAAAIKEKWPHTGVVIMTGRSDEEIENHKESGLSEHWISKPFNMSGLGTTLKRAFCSDFNKAACLQA